MNPKPRRKRITQRDVANAVGCSQNTVALALRHSSRISQKRRAQILNTAQRLGYRPNLAARSLREGRSGLIGILTPLLDEPRTLFVQHIISLLHSTRYKPIVGTNEAHTRTGKPRPWHEAPWFDTMVDLQVEAVIAFASSDDPCLPRHHDMPIILVANQPAPNIPCDQVSADRAQGSDMAVNHLIKLGHQRITMVQPYDAWQITAGFIASMKAAGLDPIVSTKSVKETDEQQHARVVKSIKASRRTAPTAVYVVDSRRALIFARVAREAGLRVPEDIAIVGYGYMPHMDFMNPPVTTVEQPMIKLAQATLPVIEARLQNLHAKPHMEVISFDLIKRQST